MTLKTRKRPEALPLTGGARGPTLREFRRAYSDETREAATEAAAAEVLAGFDLAAAKAAAEAEALTPAEERRLRRELLLMLAAALAVAVAFGLAAFR